MQLPVHKVEETPQLRLPDITFNFHKGNENSIAANASIPESVKNELERAVYSFIDNLGRVGATCDEIEQYLIVNGKNLSHQTASARMTALKAQRVIVCRWDETPTEGKFRAKRKTRSGRNADVFIARRHATQHEQGSADRDALDKDRK